jgi:hypothetical protein
MYQSIRKLTFGFVTVVAAFGGLHQLSYIVGMSLEFCGVGV